MAELSSAETKLMLQTAREVREAIFKREDELKKQVAKYDDAVAAADEKQIFTESLLLILMSSNIIDPVANVIARYSQLMKTLKDSQA